MRARPAGAISPIFKLEIIDTAKIRILSFVNIVGQGMGGEWEHDERELRPKLAAAVAEEYRGRRGRDQDRALLGEAALRRPSTCHGLRSIARSRPANSADCRSWSISARWLPERPYPDPDPGEDAARAISTPTSSPSSSRSSTMSGRSTTTSGGRGSAGIIFDLGHGAASFWFRNAVPAIEQGFVPDSISTDLHTGNLNGAGDRHARPR